MRRLVSLCLVQGLLATARVAQASVGGTVQVSNGFEAVVSWPQVAGAQFITNLAGGATESPAGARIRSGTRSWQAANGLRTAEFARVSLGSFTSRQVVVHLAAISTVASNGMDASDSVKVYVALDGAAFAAQPDLALHGAPPGNARWAFSATNVLSTLAGLPVSNAAPASGLSPNNFATLCVNLPNTATSAALRIVAQNNYFPEVWCVDDVELRHSVPEWTPPPLPSARFAAPASVANEADGPQSIVVTLSAAADATVTVSVAGTAWAGATQDFTIASTTLLFSAAGPPAQSLTVDLLTDSVPEADETIVLTLAQAYGATLGQPAQHVLTVLDNSDGFTVMSANIGAQTSGCFSRYGDPAGRIFQGLRPDILAIQEFDVTNAAGRRAYVDQFFGTDYHYYVEPQGGCSLPNGVISRWPILNAGQWDDTNTTARDFVWATVDIPGAANLHVISVHFKAGTTVDDRAVRLQQAHDLTNYMASALFPTSDYLVVCGDLNLETRSEATLSILTQVVSDQHKPRDQYGDWDSNSTRTRPFDVVLPDPRLDLIHVPLVAGGLTFPDGLVFDSRLWSPPPPPILSSDSAGTGVAHMAVMKLFTLVDTPPVPETIPPQLVIAGDTLSFPVRAQELNGDPVTLSLSNAPGTAYLSATGAVGTFIWAQAGPIGIYTTTVYAADKDGVASSGVKITVVSDTAVWINEVHYDNDGLDVDEGFELAGAAGLGLSSYTVFAYKQDGSFYKSTNLTGALPNEGCGYGAAWFGLPGLENGTSDGLALVQDSTQVVHFITYEGPLTATNGPAAGLLSTNVGTEAASTPIGRSLQLAGLGFVATDFAWTGPVAASRGFLNAGQQITGCIVPTNAPSLSPAGPFYAARGETIRFDLAAGDPEGDAIELSARGVPEGAVFASATNHGTFIWNEAGPPGVYTTEVVAVDDDGAGTQRVAMVVFEPEAVWINELHYDNNSTDVGEGVEVAGAAGLDLSAYSLHAYNSAGTVYKSTNLTGIIDEEGCGYGAVWYALPALQNTTGGMALAVGTNRLVQFLSYEGTLAAVTGPAAGVVSADVLVAEPDTTPVGQSLQLLDAGQRAADFYWAEPATASPGLLNAGQFIVPCAASNLPPRLFPIGSQVVTQGQTLTFAVVAVDLTDQDMIVVDALDVPPGATFAALTNAVTLTNQFTWIEAGPAGVYTTRFFAADDDGTNYESVAIAVLAPPAQTTNGALVWINEINYDPVGVDSNEFIEVAGAAGTDLSAYTLVYYNGADGLAYGSNVLAGIMGDEGCGYGAVAVPVSGLQNGPDGLAMILGGTSTVEFLSYEGSFTAADGPAQGLLSTTTAVSQSGSNTNTIQRTGSGTNAVGFVWTLSRLSAGALNDSQHIAGCTAPPPTNLFFTAASGAIAENGGAFTVTVAKSVAEGVASADLLWSGSAQRDVDFAAAPTNIVLSGSVTSLTVVISLIDDALVEGTETATLALANASGAAIADPGVFTLAIPDDDVPPPNSSQLVVFRFNSPPHLPPTSVASGLLASSISLSGGASIESNVTTGTYFPDEPYVEGTGGWTASQPDTAKHYLFTVTPDAGWAVSITGISFRAYATSAGPSAFTWSIAGMASNTVLAPNSVLVTVADQVSGISNLAAAFQVKLYGWTNGTRATSGNGIFKLDDVVLYGFASSANPDDMDQDGLPDAWELVQGLNPAASNSATDNADGDWMTDHEEYAADTQPTNAASYFPLVVISSAPASTMALVIDPTATGRVYGVRWTTNLLAAPQSWLLLPPERNGSGSALTFTITNQAPGRHYRTGVRLP